MKCKEFEICALNSDAECFKNNTKHSSSLVQENPLICKFCCYNKQYQDLKYSEWVNFLKDRGLKPK
jgi:hypothetical protein